MKPESSDSLECPDGGKSLWENVWRLAVERYHSQKSPVATPETPVHSRPGTSLCLNSNISER